MSITTNAEAQAVHTLLAYLLPQMGNGAQCLPSSDAACDAAALLAKSAHDKLMCGPGAKRVAQYWYCGMLPSLRGQL